MSRKFTPLLLILAFVFVYHVPALAGEALSKRTLSVTGTGIAKARPDTASISIGVVSEGKTAREALDLVTSFEAWDRLRSDQHLGRERAEAAITAAALALLGR